MADPTPQPAPQPASPDYSLLLMLLIAYLLLSGGIGGGSSPTKIIPAKPAALTVFDDDPASVQAMPPGLRDVIDSTADDAILTWFTKGQGGQWLKYGTKEPVPDPKLAGNDWAVEAYQVWVDAGKKVPWTVASGPTGRGYSGPTPADQVSAAKLLKVTGK